MRVIKFRAWDTATKELRRDVTGFEGVTGLMDGIFVDGAFRSILRGEAVPMQFTGLTDKNGKEIFEGDIFSDGEGTFQVWWNEKVGVWAISDSDGVAEWLSDYNESYEIIGSIYENPELLNQ